MRHRRGLAPGSRSRAHRRPPRPKAPGREDHLADGGHILFRGNARRPAAFVEVGTEVTEDTVVCIIEAMKVMNEIKAETRGVIAEILVENGKPVQFGQPLFRLK